MRTRWLIPVAALAALVWLRSAGGDSTTVQKPAPAEPATAHEGHEHAPAHVLGKMENAKWSPTTQEAATSDAHKKRLEEGKPKSVTGEVVDVSCYLQLGKTGEAHVDCGSKCIRNGAPVGILQDDGDLYMLFAEEHHPRRDGMTNLNAVFLPLLAKTVTVSGMESEVHGNKALFVSAAELGAMKKAAPKKGAAATKSTR